MEASSASEYQPFPNVERRNFTQALLEVPLVVRLFNIPTGKRTLEVGCGRGVALAVLDRLCKPSRLVGLDIDTVGLTEAHRRVSGRGAMAQLVLGDVRAMPFCDGEFDVVIDFGTCYHIREPERALSEIARVLSPGGVFIYETRPNQLLSHPLRSFGRSLPWRSVPQLVRARRRLLWASRLNAGAA